MKKPPKPPGYPPRLASRPANKRRQIVLGTLVGAALALILLLVLALFLGTGRVGTGRGGAGSGIGAGSGTGSGGGGGTGEGTGGESGLDEGDDRLPGPDSPPAVAKSNTEKPNPAPTETPNTDQPAVDSKQPINEPTVNLSPRPQPVKDELVETGEEGRGPRRSGSGGEGDGSEFFGVRSKGGRIVYVVDCSSSMAGPRFQKACAELLESIGGLNSRQSFCVIFFSDQSYPMFAPQQPETGLLRATRENIEWLRAWIASRSTGGGTVPQPALLTALALKPETIFFLTDGEIEPGVVAAVKHNNRRRTKVNTIGFVNRSGEALLQRIAGENHGKYSFVP